MNNLDLNLVKQYVEENIATFHLNRIAKLKKVKLNDVLKRKNPYLFKAKNIRTSEELVKALLEAYLSSQEETIFGDFLEGLAIFINSEVYGGWKSASKGIDLEFEKDRIRYIVSIKSGPNWGNRSQLDELKKNFKTAKITLRTSKSKIVVVAVNGCCYGRNVKFDKGDYFKYCGQHFWEFISGNPNLYIDIIEPLGTKAKERNDEFFDEYAVVINMFTRDFTDRFCIDGKIDWEALVRFNSAKKS
ncbi:MAG: cytosolic protein [Planctomycetes bacterium]|nr:cytosolic protein [Planctomycetota bacterium]